MKNQIKEKYCLEINKIIKNENSTDGNVYMLYTSSDVYIAKIYDDESHVKSLVKLYSDLIENKMNTPKIILTKDEKEYLILNNNKYCVIYSFLHGKEIGDIFNNLNKSISIKIAQELKRFHKITSGNNVYNFESVPFNLNKKFDRCSVLHFDLTRCNIFYNSDWKEQIGFIDFDDAKYGPSIVDVAIAASLLYFSKSKGVNIEGLKAFINEYYDDSADTKEKEVPYLKQCALNWITYIMENNKFDSSTTESFQTRKNLIEYNMSF